MTFLVERLNEIQRYVDHLESLKPKVQRPRDLEGNLSLRNDVLFSLLMIAQMVIDVCGELSTRENLQYQTYVEAVSNLRRIGGFPEDMVTTLLRVPGFRNIVVHEYVGIDDRLVVEAVYNLEPIREFVRLVTRREESDSASR